MHLVNKSIIWSMKRRLDPRAFQSRALSSYSPKVLNIKGHKYKTFACGWFFLTFVNVSLFYITWLRYIEHFSIPLLNVRESKTANKAPRKSHLFYWVINHCTCGNCIFSITFELIWLYIPYSCTHEILHHNNDKHWVWFQSESHNKVCCIWLKTYIYFGYFECYKKNH